MSVEGVDIQQMHCIACLVSSHISLYACQGWRLGQWSVNKASLTKHHSFIVIFFHQDLAGNDPYLGEMFVVFVVMVFGSFSLIDLLD